MPKSETRVTFALIEVDEGITIGNTGLVEYGCTVYEEEITELNVNGQINSGRDSEALDTTESCSKSGTVSRIRGRDVR